MDYVHFFIVNEGSDTWNLIDSLFDRISECNKAVIELSNELGFRQWRHSNQAAYGGISTVVFDKKPDSSIWKKAHSGDDEYTLRSTGSGVHMKYYHDKFNALPIINDDEMNSCVGVTDSMFGTVGYVASDTAYGYVVKHEWKRTDPKDVEEVTFSQFFREFPSYKLNNKKIQRL